MFLQKKNISCVWVTRFKIRMLKN